MVRQDGEKHTEIDKALLIIEAQLRQYSKTKERVPSKLVERYFELFDAQKEANDPVSDDFVDLYHLYIKTRTFYYFENTIYSFKRRTKDVTYSLEGWLDNFFLEIKHVDIDIKSRKVFISYIANHLGRYIRNLKKKPLTHSGVCIVTGYIAMWFNHVNSEEAVKKKPSYGSYNRYLYKQIHRVWKPDR